MSYARSPSEGDVYVIASKGKNDLELHWECMGCDLTPAVRQERVDWSNPGGPTPTGQFFWSTGTFVAATPGQMAVHLRLHRAVGQTVPDRALTRLDAEQQEWLAAKNAELETLGVRIANPQPKQ